MEHDVELCPHRTPVPGAGPDLAECELLRRLSGVEEEDGGLCRVGRDACASCRDESAPSESRLNPTVASLLYDLSGRLLARGGAGCDRQRTARLREWAEESLFAGRDVEPPALPAGWPRRPARPSPRRPGPVRIGLIGWNTPSGLGTLNRGIARNLPIARWLIPPHPRLAEDPWAPPCRACRGTSPDDLCTFLDGLDWLLFCEEPYVPAIVPMARALGVRIACVPMWEALDELSPWIRDVDLFVCPTRHSHELLSDWRDRLGLRSELAHVPWPIELERFPFRPRTVCRRFLFIHGFGGARIRDQDTPDWDGRKGLAIVAEAARRAPGVPIVVRSQWPELPFLGENVEVVCGGVAEPAELYELGDVCLQPSRWEGLGLPLLECQASGLPLITTDAPPMNEHRALATLPARATRARLDNGRTIIAHDVDPALLAEALLRVHGSDVADASRAARRFVESGHSWPAARLELLESFSPKRPII